jgi:hypothetical protein
VPEFAGLGNIFKHPTPDLDANLAASRAGGPAAPFASVFVSCCDGREAARPAPADAAAAAAAAAGGGGAQQAAGAGGGATTAAGAAGGGGGGVSTLQVAAPTDYSWFEPWAGTAWRRRGSPPGYDDLKAQIGGRLSQELGAAGGSEGRGTGCATVLRAPCPACKLGTPARHLLAAAPDPLARSTPTPRRRRDLPGPARPRGGVRGVDAAVDRVLQPLAARRLVSGSGGRGAPLGRPRAPRASPCACPWQVKEGLLSHRPAWVAHCPPRSHPRSQSYGISATPARFARDLGRGFGPRTPVPGLVRARAGAPAPRRPPEPRRRARLLPAASHLKGPSVRPHPPHPPPPRPRPPRPAPPPPAPSTCQARTSWATASRRPCSAASSRRRPRAGRASCWGWGRRSSAGRSGDNIQ